MIVRFVSEWKWKTDNTYVNTGTITGHGWDNVTVSITVTGEGMYLVMISGYADMSMFFAEEGVLLYIIENGCETPSPNGIEVGANYIALTENGVRNILENIS